MTRVDVAAFMLGKLSAPHQWTQHEMVNHDGSRRCLLGTLNMLPFIEDDQEEIDAYFSYQQKLAGVIQEQYPDRICQSLFPDGKSCCEDDDIIVAFNDHPDTRFTDVRCVLEKAAR